MRDERKRQAVEAVRARMTGCEGADLRAACLFWAGHTCDVLCERGLRPVLQAGTMMWRFCAPELDDGIGPTHFGYAWEPESLPSLAARAAGRLPEMHVWVGLPETQEIVDLTTCYLPEQARAIAGFSWSAPPPPDYLWAPALPEGAVFEPNREATLLADRCLRSLKGGTP